MGWEGGEGEEVFGMGQSIIVGRKWRRGGGGTPTEGG